MQKRGQLAGEIFLYILGLIVISFIILFGYKTYSDLRKSKENYALLQFTKQLQNDITNGRRYNDFSVKTYQIPYFSEICFADLENINPNDVVAYPVIKDSIVSGENKNVFLITKGRFETLFVEGIKLIDPHFHCSQIKNGMIEIRIEGQGDRALVKLPPSEKYCQTAKDKGWCNNLDIIYYQGSKAECCKEYNICC